MKEVITEIPQVNIRNVAETTPSKYYAFRHRKSGMTGFIVQAVYCQGCFHALSSEGLTYHNTFPDYKADCIVDIISNLLKDGNKVYEFDTAKEMFAWLSGFYQ